MHVDSNELQFKFTQKNDKHTPSKWNQNWSGVQNVGILVLQLVIKSLLDSSHKIKGVQVH